MSSPGHVAAQRRLAMARLRLRRERGWRLGPLLGLLSLAWAIWLLGLLLVRALGPLELDVAAELAVATLQIVLQGLLIVPPAILVGVIVGLGPGRGIIAGLESLLTVALAVPPLAGAITVAFLMREQLVADLGSGLALAFSIIAMPRVTLGVALTVQHRAGTVGRDLGGLAVRPLDRLGWVALRWLWRPVLSSALRQFASVLALGAAPLALLLFQTGGLGGTGRITPVPEGTIPLIILCGAAAALGLGALAAWLDPSHEASL